MILIALVALIVFGPRKLPQIGRTIGKYTAEFKRVSRDFRDTFEREVNLAELEEKQAAVAAVPQNENLNDDFGAVENTIGRSSPRRGRNSSASETGELAATPENNTVSLPEIRAINQSDFAASSTPIQDESTEPVETIETAPRRKREWL